jgi:hypothetical protein
MIIFEGPACFYYFALWVILVQLLCCYWILKQMEDLKKQQAQLQGTFGLWFFGASDVLLRAFESIWDVGKDDAVLQGAVSCLRCTSSTQAPSTFLIESYSKRPKRYHNRPTN